MNIIPRFDLDPDIAEAIADAFASAMRNSTPTVSAIADSRGREFEVRSYILDGCKRINYKVSEQTPTEKWTALDMHDVVDVRRSWRSDVLRDPEHMCELHIVSRNSGTVSYIVGSVTPMPLVPFQPPYPGTCPVNTPSEYPPRC